MSTLFDGLDFGGSGHEPHVDPATAASAHAALVNASGVPTWAEAAAAGLGSRRRPRGGPPGHRPRGSCSTGSTRSSGRPSCTRAGPLLIVAGAGSGKTRVLTHRIAYLLAARGVQPGRDPGDHLHQQGRRRDARAGRGAWSAPRARAMWVSTFHSRLRAHPAPRGRRRSGCSSNFSIYDPADSPAPDDAGLPRPGPRPEAATRRARSAPDLQPQERAGRRRDVRSRGRRERARIGAGPRRGLRGLPAAAAPGQRHGLRRPDHDARSHCSRRFPDVAEHYRRRFRHVLVDEYQDTNHAQYVLVRELVGRPATRASTTSRRASSCVVGDADQSIYAFRGATIRNIVEFEQDYPDARTILLEQNYRSTQTILRGRQRRDRPQPEPQAKNAVDRRRATASRSSATSPTTSTTRRRSSRDEIDRLADEDGVRPGDVAVFYRTNAQSRALEEVFIRVGLPYKVVGGTRFYERREIHDVLAYLRVLANPGDDVNLRRILNVPKRGIGDRAEALRRRAGRARADLVRRGAAPRADDAPGIATRSVAADHGRSPRCSTSCGTLRDDADAAPADRARGGARAVRLPRRAAGQPRPAGRDPGREPRRARRRGPRVRRGAPRRPARWSASPTSWSRSRWSPTPTRSPTRARTERAGRRHPDDAAHRQGPGVPGGVPHRHGGRHLPAHARAGRRQGAGGGAPAGLRRHHPRARAAVPVRAAVRIAWGAPQYNPPSRFLDEIPAELVDWERELPGRPPSGAATSGPARRHRSRRRPACASPGNRPVIPLSSRATGSPTTPSAWARWCAPSARVTRRGRGRLRRRGGQAAAAALRPGREALTARRRIEASGRLRAGRAARSQRHGSTGLSSTRTSASRGAGASRRSGRCCRPGRRASPGMTVSPVLSVRRLMWPYQETSRPSSWISTLLPKLEIVVRDDRPCPWTSRRSGCRSGRRSRGRRASCPSARRSPR